MRVRSHTVWTTENARDHDHHVQRGDVQVVVVKDFVEPNLVARHQELSDLYADFQAQTLELGQKALRDKYPCAGQGPALHLGGTPHPVEATVFFFLILALDIETGRTMKEAKAHIRESTLT